MIDLNCLSSIQVEDESLEIYYPIRLILKLICINFPSSLKSFFFLFLLSLNITFWAYTRIIINLLFNKHFYIQKDLKNAQHLKIDEFFFDLFNNWACVFSKNQTFLILARKCNIMIDFDILNYFRYRECMAGILLRINIPNMLHFKKYNFGDFIKILKILFLCKIRRFESFLIRYIRKNI